MKKRGEIGVFDAEQYFAGIENQRLRINGSPGDDELDDEAQAADADGSLPLSPLPDLYSCGKAMHMDTKQNQPKFDDEEQHVQGIKNALRSPAPRQATNIHHNILPQRAPLQPSPALAHRTNPLPPESAVDKSLPQGKSSTNNKPQTFSPSMRLASFFARFKLSSEKKSKLPSETNASSAHQSNTPPKSSFFSNASSQTSNSKPPSPRGRFMRALSSSSYQNLGLKPLSQMQHRSNIAASTPISPAGVNVYSPITHSASTTPTSYKNPRSRPQTHVPISPSTSLDWGHNADHAGSRRSLGTHIPFIRRKLRDYLMLERSPRYHQDNNQQQVTRNKQEKRTPNCDGHQQGMNGNGISYKQSVGMNKTPSNHGPHQVRHSNGSSEKQRRASNAAADKMPVVETTATRMPQNGQQRDANSMQSAHNLPNRGAADAKSVQSVLNPQHRDANSLQSALDRQHRNANSMQSLAHTAQGAATTTTTDSSKQSSMKEMQRRMDWARQRMQAGLEVEDDTEVAEKLLRVAREHQASALSTRNQASSYATSYNKNINVSKKKKGGMNRGGFGEQGSGLVAENGRESRRSRKSSSISPFSSAARYNSGIHACTNTKEEHSACPYDSDSSSDLFEIETLQAFCHVAGLYRPRDLPVYDTKSPRHTSK